MINRLLNTYLPNSLLLHSLISSEIEKKILPKGKTILEVGNKCDSMFYVAEGLVRGYVIGENKEKITIWFIKENTFFTSMQAYNTGTATQIGIETVENTTLLSCSKKFVDKMVKKHTLIANIYNQEIEKNFIVLENLLISQLLKNAQVRYDELISENPGILNRAPLGQIASYLGVTQSTLSRIRKKASLKKQ